MSIAALLTQCCHLGSTLGWTTIVAEENGTRLKPPYVTVKVIAASAPLGSTDDIISGSDPEKFTRIGQRETTVSFTTFGPDAMDMAAAIADALRDQAAIDIFDDAGFAVRAIDGVFDATELLESKYERRGKLDVHFGYAVVALTDLGLIEKVSITGKVKSLAERSITIKRRGDA